MLNTATFVDRLTPSTKWLFFVVTIWFLWVGTVSAEQITSFVSDITIQSDSSLDITETITYDFEGVQKHGIYRSISEKHAQPDSAWYKERYVEYELISVTRDGVAEPYALESYPGLSVKIGNPNNTITGQHVYEITYRARGALSENKNGTELYWNVTGNEWEIPILQVVTIVSGGVKKMQGEHFDCYAGVFGVVDKCDDSYTSYGRTFFKQRVLIPGDNLTVAQELFLSSPILKLERIKTIVVLFVLITALLCVFIYLAYNWRTKNRSSTVVVPQYEPYQNINPLFSGVLFDNKLHARDITAGLIFLAQNGFISIKEVTRKAWLLFEVDDYEITLLKSENESASVPYRKLLRLIFRDTGGATQESLSSDFMRAFNSKYQDVVLNTVPKTVLLSKVKSNKELLRSNYSLIKDLKNEVKNEMVTKGFLDKVIKSETVISFIFIAVMVMVFLNALLINVPYAFIFVIIFIVAVVITITIFSERRTKLGFEALNHLKGFKLFLSVTDKERFEFHNAPSLNPEKFMEYLPYAIALGVESQWAEIFKDVIIDSPQWYTSNYGTFDTISFGQHLVMFTGAISSGMSVSPQSSGGSGSFGGGSSGGGSGGGGGGSW
ncbi:MAG: hypothetical protein RLZZ230_103 [Candidatus Parcubacteria bacterium]|jgi:uncharacterized membrane protein